MKNATTALFRVTKERSPFSGYCFTVTNRKDPAVLDLKKNVKRSNREIGNSNNKLRVRLMGRGPRTMWAKIEGKHPRAYDSYLPLDKAVYYDVYIGRQDPYYTSHRGA